MHTTKACVLAGGMVACGILSLLLELCEVVARGWSCVVVAGLPRSGGPRCFCRAAAAICWDLSCAARVLISALTELKVVPRAASSARPAEECAIDFPRYLKMALDVEECLKSDCIRLTSTPERARW